MPYLLPQAFLITLEALVALFEADIVPYGVTELIMYRFCYFFSNYYC